MRIWLKKNNEVPLREQLVTQIVLGIVSDDLKEGERLPSTRELARRYSIHANTVSAAYRELVRRSWVEHRQGSGIYVRQRNTEVAGEGSELDLLVSKLLRTAREKGFSLVEVRSALDRWMASQPPDHFLLIEPDDELRAILVAEIEQETGATVRGVRLESAVAAESLAGAVPAALYGQVEKLRSRLPVGTDLIALRSRSIAESIRGQESPPVDSLVSVISRWPDFLRWSKAVLVGAGLDEDALSFTDARLPGWRRGLSATSLVITDSLTARALPKQCNAQIFRILSDTSRDELKRLAKQFRT